MVLRRPIRDHGRHHHHRRRIPPSGSPAVLAYTWTSSWMPVSTEVRWELEAQGNGTLLKLTHGGFAGNAEQAKNHSIGWTAVITWLQSFVEKGETVDTRV